MTPDDPRHSTVAGYRAGCREECCRTASSRYEKRRVLAASRGQRRTSPGVGARRRLQALVALGWGFPALGTRLGVNRECARRWAVGFSDLMTASTAARIQTLYNELSMTLPPTNTAWERQGVTKAVRMASKHGWFPPLAWDDIDNDPRPRGQRVLSRGHAKYDGNNIVDEVTVLRLMSGRNAPSNAAERDEAMRRWKLAGRSERSLCAALGWKEARYDRGDRASA